MKKIIRRHISLSLAAMVILVGCSLIEERGGQWPERPWSEAFSYETPYYTVYTNTSPQTARYIGELMEKAVFGYRQVLGCREVSLPHFIINAYATRKEYEKVVRRLGISPEITTGLYSPVSPAAIHLPYISDLEVPPSVTLLHEGLHQFVDRALRFLVPQKARPLLPPVKHALVSIPFWLNEGLATYMEGAPGEGDQLEIGRINRDRLIHLQKLIRTKKCPPLKKILERRYGEPFTTKDYAVCWGIVYSLRHASLAYDQENRRARLIQYLKACQWAFYTDPDIEFFCDFLPGGKPVKDFNRRWATYIGHRSREVFEKIIVGKNTTLDIWQKDWQERILRIIPGDMGSDIGSHLNYYLFKKVVITECCI